jgi:hypothetical protein
LEAQIGQRWSWQNDDSHIVVEVIDIEGPLCQVVQVYNDDLHHHVGSLCSYLPNDKDSSRWTYLHGQEWPT